MGHSKDMGMHISSLRTTVAELSTNTPNACMAQSSYPFYCGQRAIALTCLAAYMLSGGGEMLAQAPPRVEPGLSVTAESYCSDAKLRTTNARIRWNIANKSLESIGAANFTGARQSVQATVYKNGFDKGLLISLPVVPAPVPVAAAQAQAPAQPRTPRAFQIRIIEVEQPKIQALENAPETSEMGAVVEGLEPGVNYTWRILIDSGSNRVVSAPVSVKAGVCPADIVPTPAKPRAKK